MKKPYHISGREEEDPASCRYRAVRKGQRPTPVAIGGADHPSPYSRRRVIGAVGRKTIETILILSARGCRSAYARKIERRNSLALVRKGTGSNRRSQLGQRRGFDTARRRGQVPAYEPLQE